MFSSDDLDDLESKILKAEQYLAQRLSQTTISGEEALTERLIDALERAVNGFHLSYEVPSLGFGFRGAGRSTELKAEQVKAPRLSGRSTVSKGARSEEAISGADAMIVLESQVPHIEAHKGFLFQAKVHRGSGQFESLGTEEIKEQCRKMMQFTNSAYAVVYDKRGFYCFDCSSMYTSAWNSFHRDDAIPLAAIIRQFIECQIGDHNLSAIDKKSFKEFLGRSDIKNGLIISTE